MGEKLSKADSLQFLTRSREPAFKLVEFAGKTFAITRPNVGEIDQIRQMATSADTSGRVKFNRNTLAVAAMLVMVHTVGEDGKPGVRVFDDQHFETLITMPNELDTPVRVLGDACVEFMNPTVDPEASAKKESSPGAAV